MTLKVLELFGGIGACTAALKRLGIDIEVVDYVEIDKHAVASYNAINGTDFKPQDVTKWDKDIKVDFVLHGSPCQDFSLAGLQKGGDEGSGTRSSLMYETLRIVKKLKPKYVVWENVANLLSQNHFHNFANYINAMGELGYASAYKVLNAKDYGIPQNRERVFTVSVLNGATVDLFGSELDFKWPVPFELKVRLKDMLQDNPESKFYLSEKAIEGAKKTSFKTENLEMRLQTGDVTRTLRARDFKGPLLVPEKYYLSDKMLQYCIANDEKQKNKGNGFRFDPTSGDGTAKSITIASGSRMDDNFVDVLGNYSPCEHNATRVIGTGGKMDDLRIRKLTPRECWRLMGRTDDEFEKAEKVCSDSQLYKQAGNSIVVDVLVYLFDELFRQYPIERNENGQT